MSTKVTRSLGEATVMIRSIYDLAALNLVWIRGAWLLDRSNRSRGIVFVKPCNLS